MNSALFCATQGGKGLTGVILSAAFRLLRVETAYLREETLVARDLDHTMALFEESAGWPYSVAWIDCLAEGAKRGRALVSRGAHLPLADLPASLRNAPLVAHRRGGGRVPIDAPSALLNRATVRLFNLAYYGAGSLRARACVVHYDGFFFPLDRLLEWNRLYGRRGFLQYQCVLPKSESARGLTALLNRTADSGAGSFLAVLKLLVLCFIS
jgi:decaprenylphospho-beta-D-ribofuranose 2-oxidase